jgi:hypothetical protein
MVKINPVRAHCYSDEKEEITKASDGKRSSLKIDCAIDIMVMTHVLNVIARPALAGRGNLKF